ncbi:tetratricopeptide repeat protein [Neolewinella agarilytica]|uniref:Tetratricopeptide repeat-containing protein n=1 Tax=Neolewinella agarilytica TaxID=478744 RepID=A0A1H9IMC7_9BACT|nr:tetratricopeptide repeat protein [Neolewinella agarilytica]SEQ75734.1 Tetratricopeptide repeat-containing protein [Neolewinella agarilytica]
MRNVLLLCFTLFSSLLLAQMTKSQTPAGLKNEGSFIEAKREALLGKTTEAIGLFKELAEMEPDNDAIQFELGRLQYGEGNTNDAINHLRKAYATRPNEVYAAFLAELYQASGQHREGAALFAGLIKKNPAREDFYLERAAFLVRAQDIRGAIASYNQLEDRIGVNAELARRKHALYLGQGDQKRAEKELTALVAAQPDNLAHRHLLAGYYQSQGDAGKARKTYQEILSIQPADVRAQLAMQEVGNKPAAAADDDKLLALLGRADVDIDLKVGKLLPLVQQVASTQDAMLGQRAMRLAAELRRVHPDEAKAAAIEGDLYFHTGQLDKAAEAYIATIELDDTVYPVWEQLLATLYLDNQISELRKYAEDALDVYPNRPAVYVHYAIGEALRADFDEANSLLSQASLMVSGQPEAAAAMEVLAEAFAGFAEGNTSAGLDLAKLPGGAAGPLGFLWANADKAAALLAYDRPGNTNALFLELLGDAQAAGGDKAAAAKTYARAKSAGSKSAKLSAKISKVRS